MNTLEKLRKLHPEREWCWDPISGAIYLSHNDMAIHAPFLSECGRFRSTPKYYEISLSAALLLHEHNTPLNLENF